MRIVRILGNIALWVGAFLGVVAGGFWMAGQLGWVQPLIVISGSMEPNINTGDLLIDVPIGTSDVEVGDVVSIHSDLTGTLVSHRVVSIAPVGDASQPDRWEIRLQGDANPREDIEPYIVGDEVLHPIARIPGAGTVVSKLMDPAMALPIVLALMALLGLSLLDQPVAHSSVDDDDDDDRSLTLDEIDRALVALGVDVSVFDHEAPESVRSSSELGDPDDGESEIDGDRVDDDDFAADTRQLVSTG